MWLASPALISWLALVLPVLSLGGAHVVVFVRVTRRFVIAIVALVLRSLRRSALPRAFAFRSRRLGSSFASRVRFSLRCACVCVFLLSLGLAFALRPLRRGGPLVFDV